MISHHSSRNMNRNNHRKHRLSQTVQTWSADFGLSSANGLNSTPLNSPSRCYLHASSCTKLVYYSINELVRSSNGSQLAHPPQQASIVAETRRACEPATTLDIQITSLALGPDFAIRCIRCIRASCKDLHCAAARPTVLPRLVCCRLCLPSSVSQ